MIFDFIIETSIISSFLVILILIVQKIFKNKIAPHIGYYIWMILIVKLLVPINIQSDLSLERLINIEPLRVQQVNNNDSRVMTEEIGMEKTINQKSYFKFLWFFTVSLIFCYGLFLYAKLKLNIRKAEEIKDLRYMKILRSCKEKLKIRSDIKIVEGDFIKSPAIVGIIKPIILIPKGMLKNMQSRNIEFIFLHELTHFKYGDIGINILLQVIKALYFFNPIIYFAMKKINDECEIACDYRVLKHIGNEEFKNYGNALIDLSVNECKREYIPLSVGISMNKKELKRRIVMIGKNNKFGKKQVIIGLGALLMVGAVGLTTYAQGADANGEKIIEVEKTIENKDGEKVEFIIFDDIEIIKGTTKENKQFISEEGSKIIKEDIQFLNTEKGETIRITTEYEDGEGIKEFYDVGKDDMKIDEKTGNTIIEKGDMRIELNKAEGSKTYSDK